MSDATEDLITRLAREATPVKRLRPPMLRAVTWLLAMLAVSAGLIIGFADLDVVRAHASSPAMLMELAGTLMTGILATIAAFHLSLPDRSPRWALLPLPALAVWLSGSGMGCYREWLVLEDGNWRIGQSGACLLTIVGFGVPLALALLWALSRAKPLAPAPVAATAGLAAAALGAFLLTFFHAVPTTFMDLTIHAVAVIGVVIGCRYGGARWVARAD